MTPISRLLRYSGRAPELLALRRETPAWRQVAKRYLNVGSTPYPFQIPLAAGGGLTVSSPAEVKVFWHIFVRRCYRVASNYKLIIDAGANIGAFAVWAARRAPSATIVALEPVPSTFESLEKNIRANGMQDRIRALQLGLAGDTGERRIQTAAESPNHNLVARETPLPPDQETIGIRCLSLADLFNREHIPDFDLLKMDIEGSEWEVLMSTPSSLLRNVRHLELEYHDVNPRYGYAPEKLFAHLAQAGLQLVRRTEDAQHTGVASFQRM